jgi:hypothetical protein
MTIWYQPTKTLEDVLENKSFLYSFFILFLVSLSVGLTLLLGTGVFNELSFFVLILMVSGFTFGVLTIGWMLHAAFYLWIGKILGGSGGFRDMLRVTSVGMIPFIALIPFHIVVASFYRNELSTGDTNSFIVAAMPTELMVISTLLLLILSVFCICIVSKAIGVVHQFSALRGLSTIVLALGFFFVLGIIFLSATIKFLITLI